MNELDRRIAEEVMGESQPSEWYSGVPGTYGNNPENWVCIDRPMTAEAPRRWEPLPFSSSLEHAMKAVDKWLDVEQRYQELWLTLSYDRAPEARTEPWDAYLSDADDNAFYPEDDEYLGRYPGQTAPDAICNLLLALAEFSKEKP